MLKILGRIVYKLFNIEIRNKRNWKKDNKWLIDNKFNTIIDIGANEGQFAQKMRLYFPNANIISFEPIYSVYQRLIHIFSKDAMFKAYPYALGDAEKEAEFNQNENSESSSMLKMKDHTAHFNNAVKTTQVTIKVMRLDDVLSEVHYNKPVLVKIDVQGFEDQVIIGGKKILSEADMILCEVSFVQLYEGQKLFKDIFEMLQELGFTYAGNYDQLYSPTNNAPLQADAIFIKNKLN